MKIAVIGGTGHLGHLIAAEAQQRGHSVTPLHRPVVDAADPASVSAAVAGHDAVVVAVSGTVVPAAAESVLRALPAAGVDRLLFIGGGGSLEYAPGARFVDGPQFPPEYRAEALGQARALDILRAADTPVRWSYLSPPPVHLFDGAKQGGYRAVAGNSPVTDAQGESRISTGDYAAAAVDALEQGAFTGERFTVGY